MPWKIGLSSPLKTGRSVRRATTASKSAGTAIRIVNGALGSRLNSSTCGDQVFLGLGDVGARQADAVARPCAFGVSSVESLLDERAKAGGLVRRCRT